jgi:hypothetical protein
MFRGSQANAEDWGGGAGYLSRQMIAYLREIEGGDPQAYAEAFQFISGLFHWNVNYGNFAYWVAEGATEESSGTGLPMVDPQAWYFWNTGLTAVWQHLQQYMTAGIPFDSGGVHRDGAKPYGDWSGWTGQWEDRFIEHIEVANRAEITPPAQVKNLAASGNGSQITLTWTGPANAARYHIVWADRPIAATSTSDPAQINWWAANVVGPDLVPQWGKKEQLTIEAATARPLYFGLFSFDAQKQMSALSNAARLN